MRGERAGEVGELLEEDDELRGGPGGDVGGGGVEAGGVEVGRGLAEEEGSPFFGEGVAGDGEGGVKVRFGGREAGGVEPLVPVDVCGEGFGCFGVVREEGEEGVAEVEGGDGFLAVCCEVLK